MKLLKLSSDNPKFKTITFKSGLNILAGLQLSDADKKTINGIGKSFSLNLLHLMFGSKLDNRKKSEKQIKEYLSDYGAFYLELESKGVTYKLKKDFSESLYYINDESYSSKEYQLQLKQVLLNRSTDKNLSFRQVLNSFARRYQGTYYSDALTQQGMPIADFNQRYVNLSLLGLDTSLVLEKAAVKDALKKLKEVSKAIKDYEKTLDLSNLKDLKDELEGLKVDKSNFVIAENYDHYENKANELTKQINSIRNEKHRVQKLIKLKLDNLEYSKSESVDVDKIEKIYDEAKFFFNEAVKIRLKDAQDFHLKLMKSRKKRIEQEVKLLRQEIINLDLDLAKLEKQRDLILKDLDSKGALEEYNSISERIKTLESEIFDQEKYKKLLNKFKVEKTELDLKNSEIMVKSVKYLNDSKDELDNIENKFRTLVKKFYANHGGALKIKETVDAKYLYDVDIHVPRDGSQGINEVKIFCYDFLLYQLNPDLLGFIAHDGCIFSEMDSRQKSMIFKVAIENIQTSNLQYFVNIGQASLDEILDADNKIGILTPEEKAEIEESIILKLYDKNPSQWLFGESFG